MSFILIDVEFAIWWQRILLHGLEWGSLYRLHLHTASNFVSSLISNASCNSDFISVSQHVWYQRLGHPLSDVLIKALSHCNVPFIKNKEDTLCTACQLDKSHCLPFTTSSASYSSPLELVVVDLWGPTLICPNGFKYYVTFVDVITRYTWIYFFKQKYDAKHVFFKFHKLAECQLGTKLKVLQTDDGCEFNALVHILQNMGFNIVSLIHKMYWWNANIVKLWRLVYLCLLMLKCFYPIRMMYFLQWCF